MGAAQKGRHRMEGQVFGENMLLAAGDAASCSEAEIFALLPESWRQRAVCVTVFPGKNGVLVFAQAARTQLFRFSSLGEAYDALAAVPDARSAALYELPACAVLAVGTAFPLAMAEFGEPITFSEEFLLILEEHARSISRISGGICLISLK